MSKTVIHSRNEFSAFTSVGETSLDATNFNDTTTYNGGRQYFTIERFGAESEILSVDASLVGNDMVYGNINLEYNSNNLVYGT